MNLKFYLRGLGIGIAVTTLVMGFSFNNKEPQVLSDSEIISKAEALGMVMEDKVLVKQNTSETSSNSDSDEKNQPDQNVIEMVPEDVETNDSDENVSEEAGVALDEESEEMEDKASDKETEELAGKKAAEEEATKKKAEEEAAKKKAEEEAAKKKAEEEAAKKKAEEEAAKKKAEEEEAAKKKAEEEAAKKKAEEEAAKKKKAEEEAAKKKAEEEAAKKKAEEEAAKKKAEEEAAKKKAEEEANKKPAEVPANGTIIIISVKPGSGSETVSSLLYKAGLVDSATKFNAYLCSGGYDRKLTTGDHSVPAGSTYAEIAKIMTSSKR